MKKRIIIVLALAPAIVVAGAVSLYILFAFVLVMPSTTNRPVADYGTFILKGRSDGESYEFYKFLSSDNKTPLASIYVEVPGGRRFSLSGFPEEVAGELLRKGQVTKGSGEIDYWELGHTACISFVDGKPSFVSIKSGTDFFKISPHKDGPYLELPISQEKMIEVFGEPQAWKRGLPDSHGP